MLAKAFSWVILALQYRKFGSLHPIIDSGNQYAFTSVGPYMSTILSHTIEPDAELFASHLGDHRPPPSYTFTDDKLQEVLMLLAFFLFIL